MPVIVALLSIVILVLLLAGCIAVLVRCLTAPGAPRTGAACGRCAYAITTLRDGRCPECGGDLAHVGLATRALVAHHRGSTGLAIIAWTLLLGVLAAIALPFLARTTTLVAAPVGPNATSSTLTFTHPALQTIAPNVTVSIVSTDPTGGGVANVDLTITRPDGRQVTGTWDANGFLIAPSGGAYVRTMGPADLKPFFDAVQIDVATPPGVTAGTDIATLMNAGRVLPSAVLDTAATMPLQVSRGTLTSGATVAAGPQVAGLQTTTRSVPIAFLIVLFALPLTIWLAGIILIARRRAALTRPDAPQRAPTDAPAAAPATP